MKQAPKAAELTDVGARTKTIPFAINKAGRISDSG